MQEQMHSDIFGKKVVTLGLFLAKEIERIPFFSFSEKLCLSQGTYCDELQIF
jgi:hypothetical protein